MSEHSATAANIIASLGIKGATAHGNLPGYVPILGEDGKLDASFIPANAAQLAIPALSGLAIVDPCTAVADGLRNGSVVAPFKSLAEAAENFIPTPESAAQKIAAFLLVPGKYTDDTIEFPASRAPLSVFIIGIGSCTLAANTVAIYGLSSETSGRRPSVVFQNIIQNGVISVSANADLTVLGKSHIHELNGQDGTTLSLVSESRVDSTNAVSVDYLTNDSVIGNTSEAKGTTVRDALSTLHRRRLRMSRMTAGSSGFEIDSSSPFDITVGSSGSDEIYDIRPIDRVLINGINRLFGRGKDIVAESVTAQKVVADIFDVRELRMNALMLGGYKLTIDPYGYLVVMDGSVDPPHPPEYVFRMMDSNGAIYVLGIANGRLYLAEEDVESSSDSSSSEVPRELTIYDPESGYTYSISLEDGRMVISRIGG